MSGLNGASSQAAEAAAIPPNNNELVRALAPVCADHRSGVDGASSQAAEKVAILPGKMNKLNKDILAAVANKSDGSVLGTRAHATQATSVPPDKKRKADNNVLGKEGKTHSAREDALPSDKAKEMGQGAKSGGIVPVRRGNKASEVSYPSS